MSAPILRALEVLPCGPQALNAALGSADPGELVGQAARHGLGGVLLDRLVEFPHFPAAPLATLRKVVMGSTANTLKVKRLLVRVVAALRARGVAVVALKGYALGARVYETPLQRPTSDVDVLISPLDLKPARAVMGELGLTPKLDSDDYYPPQYRHHEAFAGSAGLVELHFRLMSNWGATWEANEVLARALPARVDDLDILTLSREDEFVYLSLHAANHMLSRLGWLYDLKLFVRAYPALDWDRVVEVARATRMPSPTFYALDAAHRLLGAAIPLRVLSQLAPNWLTVEAARRVFSGEHLVHSYLDDHKLTWAAAKVLLADSPRRVVTFAARRLVWNARR